MSLYTRERARSALFHTVGFRMVSQASTVLGYVVLVRGMSAESLGIYSLLYSVIPLIASLASLGLDATLKRFQPEFLRAGNLAASAWLVRVVTVARLLSSVAVIAVILLAWDLIAPVFKLQGHLVDFAEIALVLILYFQVIILQNALAAHMLHRYSVSSAAVLSMGKLLSYVALGYGGVLSLKGAILADTIAYILSYSFLCLAYLRMCRREHAPDALKPAPEERARVRHFAIMSNFSDIGSLLLYIQTDNFFIGAFMNPAAVGAYAFYARLNEMTFNLIPVKLFENVVNPLMFSVPPDQAAERLPRYFTFLLNTSLVAQLPLIAYATAYHHEIVQVLFGGKFIEYSPLLPLVVLLAIGDNVVATPVTMIAQYIEKASIILKSQLFGLYQIASMLLLIPRFGLYGAAFSTGTLHLLRNAYVWWCVRKYAKWVHWKTVMLFAVSVWGSAIACCFGIKALTNWPPLANMACGLAVCMIAAVVYMRGPGLAESDREMLARLLHGREAGVLRWVGLTPQRIS